MVHRCLFFRSRKVSLVFEEELRILARSAWGRGLLSPSCLLSHILLVHVRGGGRGARADLHAGSMDGDSLWPGFLSVSPRYASFLVWKLPGQFLSLCGIGLLLFLPRGHFFSYFWWPGSLLWLNELGIRAPGSTCLRGSASMFPQEKTEQPWPSFKCISVDSSICAFTYEITYQQTTTGSVGENLPADARDTRDVGLIPGPGRSPREGNGCPLQYSCLENSMERGA